MLAQFIQIDRCWRGLDACFQQKRVVAKLAEVSLVFGQSHQNYWQTLGTGVLLEYCSINCAEEQLGIALSRSALEAVSCRPPVAADHDACKWAVVCCRSHR